MEIVIFVVLIILVIRESGKRKRRAQTRKHSPSKYKPKKTAMTAVKVYKAVEKSQKRKVRVR